MSRYGPPIVAKSARLLIIREARAVDPGITTAELAAVLEVHIRSVQRHVRELPQLELLLDRYRGRLGL